MSVYSVKVKNKTKKKTLNLAAKAYRVTIKMTATWSACRLSLGWEHHAVHAAVWQRHLRIWTWEFTGTSVFVCVHACVRVCSANACACLLSWKLVLVCLLRAVITEGTQGSSPLSGTSTDNSPSNSGAAQTPFSSCRNIVLLQRHKDKQRAHELLAHPRPFTCLNIYYFCW